MTNELLARIALLEEKNNQLKEQLEKKYEKVGTLTTEILYEENSKLQSVLKELRSWLEDEIIDSKAGGSQYYWFGRVLSKLNELENKDE